MISRTTNSQTNNSLMAYVNASQAKLSQLTIQLASGGKKVSRMSDDAVAAKSILNANKELNKIGGYETGMKYANGELATTDSTLKSANTGLQKAYDIAMQAANGTYGEEQINAFKTQLDAIISTMKNLANTEYNGAYIFAGTKVGEAPFVEDTVNGGIQYKGTESTGDYERKILIGDNIEEAINLAGDDVFGYANYTVDPITGDKTLDGKGIFGTLYALKDALNETPMDTDKVAATLDGFAQGIEKISDSRAKVGVVQSRMDTMIDVYDNNELQITQLKSNLQDADLSSLISEWTTQQYALEASYKIASQMLSTNFMNYI